MTGRPRHDRRELLATTLADQVALALANLRLRESLRSQAIRDPLTGLFNRRYMEETIERELSRASRAGSEVGIVMIDIDHFKAYNDSFGHEAGDVLLAALGAYLRKHLRAGDIACRYGGEEFLLIVPDATFEAVVQRAQAVLDGVREISPVVRGRALESVTVSIGVAAYPWHGINSETLLRAADEALYRAKAQGRARIVAGSPPERSAGECLPDRTAQLQRK